MDGNVHTPLTTSFQFMNQEDHSDPHALVFWLSIISHVCFQSRIKHFELLFKLFGRCCINKV